MHQQFEIHANEVDPSSQISSSSSILFDDAKEIAVGVINEEFCENFCGRFISPYNNKTKYNGDTMREEGHVWCGLPKARVVHYNKKELVRLTLIASENSYLLCEPLFSSHHVLNSLEKMWVLHAYFSYRKANPYYYNIL